MRHEVKVLGGYFLLGDSYKEFCGYITQHMQHYFTDLGLLSYHDTLFINAKITCYSFSTSYEKYY